MSLPRYPKYKDSGVEWLGQVPEGWEVMPLKYFARVGNGSTPSRENPAYWDGGHYPWLSSTVVNQPSVECADEFVTDVALRECHLPIVSPPAVLLGITGQGRTRGMATTLLMEATINQHIAYVAPDQSHCLVTWIRYVLDANYDSLRTESEYVGSTKGAITCEQISAFSSPLPPVHEQQAIAAFLDRETAKIDALMAEQQRLIDLLKEKRQAVISHAVTKGLNPDAPMNSSNIDAVGAVPRHWKVIALKRIAHVNTGMAKGKDHGERATISVPYLRVANVQDGYLDLDEVSSMDIPAEDLPRYELKPGDVLMNEGGDFDKLGRGCVWHGQIAPCITQNHVFAVRPRLVNPDWLSAVTSSDYAQFYFMTRSKQSTNLASISSTNLMELPVVLPPEQEALEILETIKQKTRAFDDLLTTAESAIALLRERRAALISAAVTGQVDVRHLGASESA